MPGAGAFERAWAEAELQRLAAHLAERDIMARPVEGALPSLLVEAGGRQVLVTILSDAAEDLPELALVQLYADLGVSEVPRDFAARVAALAAIGGVVLDDGAYGFRHVNAFRAESMLNLGALTQLLALFVHQVDRVLAELR